MCLKQKSGTQAAVECVTDFVTTFWRPLSSITEQTHGNMESICFVQSSEKKKDRYLCPILERLKRKTRRRKKRKKERKMKKKKKKS